MVPPSADEANDIKAITAITRSLIIFPSNVQLRPVRAYHRTVAPQGVLPKARCDVDVLLRGMNLQRYAQVTQTRRPGRQKIRELRSHSPATRASPLMGRNCLRQSCCTRL